MAASIPEVRLPASNGDLRPSKGAISFSSERRKVGRNAAVRVAGSLESCSRMKRLLLAALSLTLLNSGAAAAMTPDTADGALALAGLVAENSPSLSADKKRVMALALDGDLDFEKTSQFTVQADAVTCRASQIDLATHTCDLTFGGKVVVTIRGRKAHELYATIAEVGVPASGAAGTLYEAIVRLTCTIDPSGLQQRGGAGATCQFSPGPE